MGLSIAKATVNLGVVELHGGAITANQSQRGGLSVAIKPPRLA